MEETNRRNRAAIYREMKEAVRAANWTVIHRENEKKVQPIVQASHRCIAQSLTKANTNRRLQ